MNKKMIISESELNKYCNLSNLTERAGALLLQQKKKWDLVNDNFNALENVKTAKYNFDDIYITTQFNPSRIISSSAKVDKKSIENRKCFLCKENLPEVQKGILYSDKYVLLINPYPIFKHHLTIPHLNHIPQKIEDSFNDLLELSKDLEEKFFVFYNGPKCGASAPDHLHFQAGLKNSTPIEKYFTDLLNRGIHIEEANEVSRTLVSERLFNFICLQSNEIKNLENEFFKIITLLKGLSNSEEEPLLNLICYYERNQWNLIIIPRKKHRPDQFFAEDNSKLLISPASVDMMGLLITAREEDFSNISKEQIENIYNQVLLSEEELLSIFKL
jgi:hypothetical protein